MIQNAVFILGAGASCPYGFPSGQELREQILSHYPTDCKNYLRARVEGKEPFLSQELHRAKQFVEKFRKATETIDLFLARNPEFSKQGKRAIIFRILAAEHASRFREETKIRNHDWYTWLFKQLTDKLVRKEDFNRFCENDVSIITFNYDRSLEHFLYDSLHSSFSDVGDEKIIEQVNEIKICHVFGQVGPLEWQDQSVGIPYRVDVNDIDIDDLRDNIKIVYEEGKSPKLEEAQELIGTANRVFFLGFGYAEENLNALRISEVLEDVKEVFGTALGLTGREKAMIESQLRKEIGNKSRTVILENDKDCLALLREFL